jgi:hypothetical protein
VLDVVAGFEAAEDVRVKMEFAEVVVEEDSFRGEVADVFVGAWAIY